MSQTLNSLYNQALTAIGHAPNVTDPNKPSKATAIVSLWYPVARRSVLSSFHWGSVRGIKRLALTRSRVDGSQWADADPAPGYRYAYALPNDCLRPRYLSDFSRFTIGTLNGEKVLNSNCDRAILHYTRDEENPALWEADLYQCVVYALAAAINVAHNGKVGVTQKLEKQVFEMIARAKTEDANEDDTYVDQLPALWAGADFTAPAGAQHARFYYPTQTFSVGAFGQ